MIRINQPRIFAGCVALAGPATASDEEDLFGSSLEDLLGTTVSTASRYEQTAREAPASVTVVTAEDIRLYGYRTLDEIFDSLPGFYVTDDRNYTYIGVRGFSRPTDYNNRMLLLLNGAAINEAVWGSSPMGSQLGINIDAIERVEIVRGPGSALYGTSAMFAVINIITRSGNQVDGVDAAVELGSFGTRSGSLTYGREFKTGLDLSISGIWEKRDGPYLYFAAYDDPSTNNGIAEDLDWEELYGVSARATYSNLAVQALFVGRDKGIPTGSYETDFNDPRSMSVDNYHLLDLEYSRAISATSHLTARASHYYYYYTGDWPYEAEVWPEDSDTRSLRAELQLRHDLRADNRLFGGVELQNHYRAEYRLLDPDRVSYYNGTLPYHVLSAYLQDEHQITSDLSATFGLRISDYSTAGTVTSPRGALIYHPGSSTTLKLLYGEAFRAPACSRSSTRTPNSGGIPISDRKRSRRRNLFGTSSSARVLPSAHRATAQSSTT
jgi:outer membrane receptor protein involved in Fe transport